MLSLDSQALTKRCGRVTGGPGGNSPAPGGSVIGPLCMLGLEKIKP